jgi:hypothetical protein
MGEDLGDDWGEMVDRLEAGEELGDEAAAGGEGLGDSEDLGAALPD